MCRRRVGADPSTRNRGRMCSWQWHSALLWDILHRRSAPKCRFSATHSSRRSGVAIAPVIFCTVIHGIARISDMARVGRVALKAIIYFEVLTTIALIIGLVMVNVLKPGVGMNVDPSKVDTSSILRPKLYRAKLSTRTLRVS
jgi:Sodium:dicarboxylate symporter family